VRKRNFEIIKSVGNSTTASFNVDSKEDAYKYLFSLTESVGMRLRLSGFIGSVITVTTVCTEFNSITHQKKISFPTDSTDEIFYTVKTLFNEMWRGNELRKFGVRIGSLQTNDYRQTSLFEDESVSAKHQKLDKTVDKIRLKYGSNAIYRASFLHSGISPINGGVSGSEYPVMTSIL
jgi:DNA polymerase-4